MICSVVCLYLCGGHSSLVEHAMHMLEQPVEVGVLLPVVGGGPSSLEEEIPDDGEVED